MSDEVMSSGVSDWGSTPHISTRPISEVVITPPCHGGIVGSNPAWVVSGMLRFRRGVIGIAVDADRQITANNIVKFERSLVTA